MFAGSLGAKRPVGTVFRVAMAVVVLIACAKLLQGPVSGLDPEDILDKLQQISIAQWLVALVLTLASFTALGLYDAYVHRWFRTGISLRRASLSGAASIALSQFIGLGILTGTLARWRLLPELSMLDAAKITAAVGASFLLALAALLALILPFIPDLELIPSWVALLGGVGLGVLVCLSLAQPVWLPVKLPSVYLIGGICVATAADTTFAALALYALLPLELAMSLGAVLFAYMVALGAGILCGTPGGAGPFELALLTMLTGVPDAELIAAILAFRLVYYVVPASLGVLMLLPDRTAPTAITPSKKPGTAPESGLARLGEFEPLDLPSSAFFAAETGQALVALRDPVAAFFPRETFLHDLSREAARRGLFPALYKCSGRSAAIARDTGWCVRRIGDDCWIDPLTFTLETPKRRQLRRKLRAVEKAGVCVTRIDGNFPLDQMADIATEWASVHGRERGFSMGRWCPEYVQEQAVFAAWRNGRIEAFATFHETDAEWTLDLMRSRKTVPDGAMHALIVEAIASAAQANVLRLSLAALPAIPNGWVHTVLSHAVGGVAGLRQFKSAFDPNMRPLYLASPNLLTLALSALDIYRRVQRPVPLRTEAEPVQAQTDEYAIRSA